MTDDKIRVRSSLKVARIHADLYSGREIKIHSIIKNSMEYMELLNC